MSKRKAVTMQSAAAIATMMVPDAGANWRQHRMDAMRHVRGVTKFHEPMEKERRVRALRDDPLGLMHHRKQIGESQYRAAREFQSTWERAGTPLRSPGDIREFVDGGRGASDGITDVRMAAGKKLAQWRSMLGREGYQIVEAVLIDKTTIREVADAGAMMPSKAATTFYGHLFRRQLTALAKAMGFG